MKKDIECIIINLKVLGKITSDDSLNTRSRHFQIVSHSWLPLFMRRWWFGESRGNTIKEIDTLIKQCYEFLQSGNTSNENKIRIISAASESKTGILELQKQYLRDACILSRLELLYSQMDQLIKNKWIKTKN